MIVFVKKILEKYDIIDNNSYQFKKLRNIVYDNNENIDNFSSNEIIKNI